MAYSELIKNFNRIRDYMREFYVYGFKSREEYTQKSPRSYDDERRRLESWLGDNVQFRQTIDGKNMFISIDSRTAQHNPLYQAWKTKSFTDGDITLHFIIMDILTSEEQPISFRDITERIDDYLLQFQNPHMFDESTVRKKLKEYVNVGMIKAKKQGKMMCYSCEAEVQMYPADVLDFFSEVSPCGVVGSFLLDKLDIKKNHFVFKHHYITSAMDSEILYQLFCAMRERRSVCLETSAKYEDIGVQNEVIPLRIFISVQNGRQYLMAYVAKLKDIMAFRIDHILSVTLGESSEQFEERRKQLREIQSHIWGVSTKRNKEQTLERVSFTVRYADDEQFIHNRLEREKRCGTVEKLDENTSRFTAEFYDSNEIFPWIRTFICRIIDIEFSNQKLETRFKKDIETMYQMYGVE